MVEAQEVSVSLARRTVAEQGLDATVVHADLREFHGTFDLISGPRCTSRRIRPSLLSTRKGALSSRVARDKTS